jgi:hypothetical protein
VLSGTRAMGRPPAWLTGLALACASVSVAALLLHAAGWLPMYFLVDLLGAPSLLLLLLLGLLARRIDEVAFLNRLTTGAWAGLAATAAYDLLRWLLQALGVFRFDVFGSIPAFGMLITGRPEDSPLAIGVGWAYHAWNGFGFGIMYTLVAGPAAWPWALVWALFLEVGWLLALPAAIELRLTPELIVLSLIGHAAYGATLGLLAERFVRA